MQRAGQDWLVLAELTHHKASAVGLVTALQFAPQFLLLPLTGFVADHYNQRKLLIMTQAIMGALALTLGMLTVTGTVELWHVYIFAFLFGSASAFDATIRQTFVAELVGDADLPNAVALNSTSFNGARMVGPAIAGAVIASVGTGWAFIINGFSFLAVLLSLARLRRADLHGHPRAQRARGSFTDGFRYVWRRKDLKAILIMLFLIGTFGLNFPIFISAMAVRVFHSEAGGYGLLFSMMAIGTVIGALLSAGRDRPTLETLLGSAALFGTGCVAAAIMPDYWSFGAALALTGAASMTFVNATSALMQLSTEVGMRGRVIALRVGVTFGGTAIGAPTIGWIADHFGPRWSLGIGAAAGFAAAIVAALAIATRDKGSAAPPG